jgi:hypothetical protein
MKEFQRAIAEQQRAANVRIIKPPHAPGFLNEELRRDLRDGNTPVKATPQNAA